MVSNESRVGAAADVTEKRSDPGRPPRRIVICCDGTSNRPDAENPTNVVKIARGVSPVDSNGTSQIVFYDWGVGTKGFWDGITGGAFGWGLQKNVEDAYRFLVQNYEIGDQVYLFGFSRGAFTARSVVGLMRQCGIVKKEHAKRIPEGYADYRNPIVEVDGLYAKAWRHDYSHDMPVVQFLGVWDTVGAMGIPANRLKGAAKFWIWDKLLGRPFRKKLPSGPRRSIEKKKGHHRGKGRHSFHDMELTSKVRNAYQALAIDEKRPVFTPAIWDSAPKELSEELPDGTKKKQTIEQVWFPGTHSDVGGNQNVANSSITLKWMAEAAKKSGLEFDKHFWDEISEDTEKLGPISGSPSGFWKAAGQQTRDMSGYEFITECIHSSAIAREKSSEVSYSFNNPGRGRLPEC